ncbi:hypothetical protein HNQ56_003773 [Anaerotaenia torta]|uniref:hypothetical protein n=1 Tax=Anaerotaenia torta TaxID=433293 RepID=UPI003D25B168
MKIKQFISFVIAVLCMTAIICLTGATANKHLGIGWYIAGLSLAGLILQLDIMYLENQRENGDWK